MLKENKLISFFISLKNKINSFISNATYSSKKLQSKFNQTSGNNYANSNINIKNTYMKYLISKKIQRKNQISNPSNNIQQNSYHNFINDINGNSISTSASNLLEYSNYDNNGINLKEANAFNNENNCNMNRANRKRGSDEILKKMNKNNNNYKNTNLIGQKHLRNSLLSNDQYENDNNKDSNLKNEENSLNCTYDHGLENILKKINDVRDGDVDSGSIKNKLTESKKNKDNKFKRKSIDKIKKDIIDKRNKNEKEIIRLNNEYHNFKEKMKLKNKINELFKSKLNLNKFKKNTCNNNSQIETEKKSSKIEKKATHTFKHLSFTHPQRFSYDSSINKKKRKLSNSSSLSISFENNINIISTLKKKKEESLDVEKNNNKKIVQEIKENNFEINNVIENKNDNNNKIIKESIEKNVKNAYENEKDKLIKDNNPLSITNPQLNSFSKIKQSENGKSFNFNSFLNQNNRNININVNDNIIQNNNFMSNGSQNNINNKCYNINKISENSRNKNELMEMEMDLDEDNKVSIGQNKSSYKMNDKYLLNNNSSYKNPFLIENEKYNSKKDKYFKDNNNNIFASLKNGNIFDKSNNIFENKNNGNSIFSIKKENEINNQKCFNQMNNNINMKSNFSNIKFSFGKK